MSIQLEMPANEVPRGAAGALPVVRRTAPRALVADDDPDSAECLAMLLERDGFDVRVAHDGTTALAIAAAFQPDVAFVDVVMPECSGLEVASRIRSSSWGACMTLIATSGRTSDADKHAALAVGFDAHLSKPLDYEALRSVVRRTLSPSEPERCRS